MKRVLNIFVSRPVFMSKMFCKQGQNPFYFGGFDFMKVSILHFQSKLKVKEFFCRLIFLKAFLSISLVFSVKWLKLKPDLVGLEPPF